MDEKQEEKKDELSPEEQQRMRHSVLKAIGEDDEVPESPKATSDSEPHQEVVADDKSSSDVVSRADQARESEDALPDKAAKPEQESHAALLPAKRETVALASVPQKVVTKTMRPEKTAPASQHHHDQRPSSLRAWRKIYFGVLLLVVLALLGYAIAIYAFRVQAPWVNKVATFVPTPVGFVGWHPLWLHSYHRDVDELNHFYEQQELKERIPAPTEEIIKKIARDNLVRRGVANAVADRYGIHVSQQDIDSELERLQVEAGSKEQLESLILGFWGWSPNEFRQKVLYSVVLKQKLAEALKNDPVIGREINIDNPQTVDAYLDKIAPTYVTWWYEV